MQTKTEMVLAESVTMDLGDLFTDVQEAWEVAAVAGTKPLLVPKPTRRPRGISLRGINAAFRKLLVQTCSPNEGWRYAVQFSLKSLLPKGTKIPMMSSCALEDALEATVREFLDKAGFHVSVTTKNNGICATNVFFKSKARYLRDVRISIRLDISPARSSVSPALPVDSPLQDSEVFE